MSRLKAFTIVFSLGLMAAFFLPNSKADEWNKKTVITVSEPLAIPGKVLAPGKYVLKLLDSPSDRHIVEVYNESETQLQTTILAIPNAQLEAADKTQFSFWEMPAGQPRALKAWFYPGDNTGQEFAYPKDLAATIANTNKENVPTVENNEISQTAPSGETESAANTPPAAGAEASAATEQPAPTANQPSDSGQAATAPAPEPAPAETPAAQTPAPQPADTSTANTSQLPRTASPFPLAGLAGLFSLGGAALVRVLSKRSA
jgi:hypothetical protein